jgi:hypothetical protein
VVVKQIVPTFDVLFSYENVLVRSQTLLAISADFPFCVFSRISPTAFCCL